ncbi:hypothetical protein ACWDUH_33000 [Micromonospora wenchangensis]
MERPRPGRQRHRPDRHRRLQLRRGRLRIRLHLAGDPATLLGPAVTVLTARSAAVNAVDVGEPSLEDVFIELTGRQPR